VIHFVCWKWRSDWYRTTFTAEHVNVLAAMLRRHCSAPHRLLCVTDDAKGVKVDTHPLWDNLSELQNPCGYNLPSCYRRLRIFDPAITRAMGIADGERVVSLDLDLIIASEVSPLYERSETFVGWRGVGTYRPVVYNGSMFMFSAGALPWLWSEFDPKVSPHKTREARFFGSDQAWLSMRLATSDSPGWDTPDGVYSYSRDLREARQLPDNTRIVFFNGKRKPWESDTRARSPWITDHWRK
jgi:hypothetical protein